MRLRQLDGQWVSQYSKKSYRRSAKSDGAQGVLFQCPRCGADAPKRNGKRGGYLVGVHYVLVWFANPINAPLVPPDAEPLPRWTREGEDLDALTLSPSINCDVPAKDGTPSTCKWHGFVKLGEAA